MWKRWKCTADSLHPCKSPAPKAGALQAATTNGGELFMTHLFLSVR